jgi:pimeloyl-ACP methyl ester carboxylesterase
MRGEVRSLDGTTIRWVAAGHGQPLVFVPGGIGNEHAFDPLIAQLTHRLRCITIGRRGKGFSGDGPTYSYEREYEDIAAVLDAVGPPRLLFGHSSGAICALGAALVSHLDRLILVEPPLPLDSQGIDSEQAIAIRTALSRGDSETAVLIGFRHALNLEETAIETWRARPDWPEVVQRGVSWLRELDEIKRLPPDVDRYRAIGAETLLIYGMATQPRRRKVVEALGAAIPRAQVAAFEGYGHDVANAAAPEVAAAVLDFLEQRS